MALWSRVTARLGLSGGHLGDEELLALLLPAGSEPSSAATRAHLDRCEMCTDRSMMLQAFLSGLMETSEATLAETFPLDRLATQRERIMRRLRRSVEPARRGRVLSFPALARPALAGVHRAHRWLGATAAAGLLIGVTVGHFLHIHPELAEPAQPTTVTAGMPVTPAMASPAALERPSVAYVAEPAPDYDDRFLDELELALSSPQVPELSPLDEITPRIREVAVNLW